MDKKTQRKVALEQRNSLTQKEICEKGFQIFEKLIELEVFKNSENIMCYLSFNCEVPTGSFIEYGLKAGKKISVPVVSKKPDGTRMMYAVEIKCLDDAYMKNKFGILEPEVNEDKLVKPDKLDLVVVPALAFDIGKNRLGYGGGYYDRFLKNVRHNCLKVGIAFEKQIFDAIPSDVHDIKMDTVITENRIIT